MLNRIVAKGFLSWDDLDFQINHGITQIDGWNFDDDTSEGSGKSGVLNAICWNLYGKIPKDVNIDDVIREGQKECLTESSFTDFKIVRTRKGGRGELYMEEADGKITKGKDVKETQSLIEDRIGLTFETFMQTVYFAQDYEKKFITSDQEDKGKILSEIQDLKIFDRARKEVLELAKIENTKLSKIDQEIQLAQQASKHSQEKFLMKERFIKAQRDDQQSRIQQLELKEENLKDELQKEISSIDELRASYSSMGDVLVDDSIRQINSDIEQLEAAKQGINESLASVSGIVSARRYKNDELNGLKAASTKITNKIQTLVRFIENPNKTCPTCGTLLEQADTSHAETEIEGLNTELVENGLKISIAAKALDELIIPDDKEARAEIAEIDQAIKSMKGDIVKLQQDGMKRQKLAEQIIFLEGRLPASQSSIKKVQEEISILSAKSFERDEQELFTISQEGEAAQLRESAHNQIKDQTVQHVNNLEILKDGFKEIKSYVFNSVLSELTSKSNKYLGELFHMPVTLKFINDDMKIGTVIKLDGQERSYGLLSGGQAKRVAVAVDLALSEIITRRKNNKLNFRCFDEPFKNLSEGSMAKCVELFQKMSGSTLLIEHNSVTKTIVNNVFEVELREKISRSKEQWA